MFKTALALAVLTASCVDTMFPDDHSPELAAAIAQAEAAWAAVGVELPPRETYTIGFASGDLFEELCGKPETEVGGCEYANGVILSTAYPDTLVITVTHELGHLVQRNRADHLEDCDVARAQHVMCPKANPSGKPSYTDAAFIKGWIVSALEFEPGVPGGASDN